MRLFVNIVNQTIHNWLVSACTLYNALLTIESQDLLGKMKHVSSLSKRLIELLFNSNALTSKLIMSYWLRIITDNAMWCIIVCLGPKRNFRDFWKDNCQGRCVNVNTMRNRAYVSRIVKIIALLLFVRFPVHVPVSAMQTYSYQLGETAFEIGEHYPSVCLASIIFEESRNNRYNCLSH